MPEISGTATGRVTVNRLEDWHWQPASDGGHHSEYSYQYTVECPVPRCAHPVPGPSEPLQPLLSSFSSLRLLFPLSSLWRPPSSSQQPLLRCARFNTLKARFLAVVHMYTTAAACIGRIFSTRGHTPHNDPGCKTHLFLYCEHCQRHVLRFLHKNHIEEAMSTEAATSYKTSTATPSSLRPRATL